MGKRSSCKLCDEPRFSSKTSLCRAHLYEANNIARRQRIGSNKPYSCKYCSTLFVRRNLNQRYCDANCATLARLALDQKYPARADAQCKQCNAAYTPRGPLDKYCSQKCYENARWRRRCPNVRQPEKKLQRVCKFCGGSFEQPQRYYYKKKAKSEPIFCSHDCFYAHQRTLRGKPAIIGGKCWEAASRAARKRDGGVCCICGSSNAGGKKNIPVDHIIPRRLMESWGFEVHNVTNLASLCVECHAKKTAVEWLIFKNDVIGFVTGLARMNYPEDRVAAAMAFAKLNVPLVGRIYGGFS